MKPRSRAARPARRRDGESPRATPLCPHFGPCGGCTLLDRPYEEQLRRKHRLVVERCAAEPTLAGVEVQPIVAAPHPLLYRNRLLYPLARERGRIVGGFFRAGTHELVDVRHCAIQDPAITEIATRARAILERLGVGVHPLPGTTTKDGSAPRCGARAGGGAADVRALAVRLAPGTGEVLVGLVTTAGVFPQGAAFAERVREAGVGLRSASGRAVSVVSVVRSLNDAETNVVLGSRSLPLLGRDHLSDRFAGLRLRISLESFSQPNSTAARTVLREIEAGCGGASAGRLVDGYAGVGAFALALAPRFRDVVALESTAAAVRDGRENARVNGRANVRFEEGRFEDRLPEAVGDGGIALLLLDPPRSGLSPRAVAAVVRARPERIAYLSCSPATLARDLARLAAAGHRVERVTPHDFFPQTDHVEVLAWLRRV